MYLVCERIGLGMTEKRTTFEFTHDELDDLYCMIWDSRAINAQGSFMRDAILANHDRWLARILKAMETYEDWE